ncbi:MAG: cation diffusion facilitator family transporter [Armatimonadota bacterium]
MAVARGDGARPAGKVAAARLSVISNTLLVLGKLAVGFGIGSVAVLSEAVHSATDLVAAVIAYFAVRAADAPPDDRHPYGHGKFEALSSLIEGILIFVAAGVIAVSAVRSLFGGTHAHTPVWGMVAMGVSAAVNIGVARRLFRVARETESPALEADAHHLMTDVWTSAAVFVGLGLVAATGEARFDPLVALGVAFMVVRTASGICRDAVGFLLDGRLPDDEIEVVEGILRGDGRVLSYHKLRSRRSGGERHVDVHIQVDDDLSLREAHALTEDLEDRIRKALPGMEVVIHTEPFEEERRHHEEVEHPRGRHG